MKQFVIDHINAVDNVDDIKLLTDLHSKYLDRLVQSDCTKMCEIDDTFKFWHNLVHRYAFGYVCLYLSIRSAKSSSNGISGLIPLNCC